MFVTGKPFQPSVHHINLLDPFVSKEENQVFWKWSLVLSTNIKLTRKNFPVTNTVAYFDPQSAPLNIGSKPYSQVLD
jgi:hypothetical protein